MEVTEAMDTMRAAFKEDPNFAYTWHCNIAMACYDSMGDELPHDRSLDIANEAASKFMKLAFGVVTEQ